MTLDLHVDGDRWRRHLRSVLDRHPDLVPVAKGNGYGFGNHRLARRAAWLGVDTIAVGTHREVDDVARRFDGDILVLTPWRPYLPDAVALLEDEVSDRVIHTVGRLEDLAALIASATRPRVVLEQCTSMLRHGLSPSALREAVDLVRGGGVRLEGVALHLPLPQGSHLGEVERLLTDVVAAGLDGATVWVSHLRDHELDQLATRWPEMRFRPRTGTDLWLGDRGALRVTATVLDVHPVERGDVFGYRGRTAPLAGTILIVSGGTAHGIGLAAPTGDASVKARAAALARGGLDAAGFVRSPFSVSGKQRLFAEPPHMQSSMLFLPHASEVPSPGDTVDVRVRHTTTLFDRVLVNGG